jgi:flagellar FliJ protein
MRKFRFSLQAPLDHARHVEEQLESALAQLQRRLTIERDKLVNFVRRRTDQQLSLARECAGTLDLEQVRRRQRHIDALGEAVEHQKLAVAAAEQAVSRKREELVAAMKRRKTFERLRDRRAAEHRSEMERIEQKFSDEIAVSRHAPAAVRSSAAPSLRSTGRGARNGVTMDVR